MNKSISIVLFCFFALTLASDASAQRVQSQNCQLIDPNTPAATACEVNELAKLLDLTQMELAQMKLFEKSSDEHLGIIQTRLDTIITRIEELVRLASAAQPLKPAFFGISGIANEGDMSPLCQEAGYRRAKVVQIQGATTAVVCLP